MSKQQTLFNFIHRPKRNDPRRENGNAILQAPQNPTNWKAINQGNLDENLEDDDVLLAACEDWEESTFSPHSPGENGRTNNSKLAQSYQESPGTSRQSFQLNAQEPLQQTVLEATQLEDLPGFDVSTGNIWIYPTNYPLREYQFNIVQQALFKNTMVSLPTGLGKTFVAAVVMYNFYRWYPEGKVVFMAPTKPLVAQQIEACYSVMGIPQSDMAEMTGNMPPPERQKAWNKFRVFFLTPQVLMNDLSRRACPTQQVKCLVVDEAHKALGNHAYCQVVRELSKYSNSFRVLALSATPGSDLKAIQQVVANLLVSHIEIRSEDSIDIRPYVHERKVEKVVVPLDQELKSVRDNYLRVLSMYVSRLSNCGAVLNKDPANLTKFQVLQARDAFRQDPPPQAKSRGHVEGDFALCISLYHGYELLLQHGLRSLHNFLQNTVDGAKGFSRTRQELMRNQPFVQLLHGLRDKFGSEDANDGANRSCLFSLPGTQRVKEMKPYVTSHPKMAKLQEIVLEHFRKFEAEKASPNVEQPSTSRGQQTRASSTRVMIFAQYRDSVNEIAEMLNRHRPLLRCMGFVGQASVGKNNKGISQKEQLRVVKEFREGGYNTLVCTCVGEEGLDIGDVDLIVCYDAHKSPIRLVQRMGRTGRKRQGRIVMLVTEGKEAAVYDRSQYNKKGIVKALQGNARSLQLYPNNPRMVPRGLNPTPHKMFISVGTFVSKKDAKRKSSAVARKSSETGLEAFMAKAKNNKKEGEFLSPEELSYWSASYKLTAAENEALPSMPGAGQFITLGATKATQNRKHSRPVMSFTEWSPWQMNKQPIRFVEHSQRCKYFVELMEFIDLQNLTEGDDIYGMEMQTYLNEEDVVKPKKGGIEQFCIVRAKTGPSVSDDVKVNRPGKDGSRESAPSEKGTLDDVLGGPKSALRDLKTQQRNSEMADLISISSDSQDSDDVLPAILQENSKQQTHSKIWDSTVTTAVPKKMDGLNQKTNKVQNPDSSKLGKPKKHKQKKKHLSPVLDSSDDDDFADAKKCNKLLGDKKTPSPSMRKKDHEDVKIPETKDADVKADVFGPREMDQGSKTPEPMDVDSDNFVSSKNEATSKNFVLSKNASNNCLPDRTEEDLSFLFPTQTSFVTPAAKDDNPKLNLKKRKSVVPPPPPLSFSSLDLLDDIDTTINLTQHFQSEACSFGNTCAKNDKATKHTSFESVHDNTNPQTLNSSPKTSVEKIAPETSAEKLEKLCNVEPGALVIPDKEEILTSKKDDVLESAASLFIPQFDLNVDFTIFSSDDESETPAIPNLDKMPIPPCPDEDQNKINKDYSIVQNLNMENDVATPQANEVQTPQPFDVETPLAFDVETPKVQTPQLELTLKDPSSSTCAPNTSLPTSAASVKEYVQSKPVNSSFKAAAPTLFDTPKSGLETGTELTYARLRDKQMATTPTERLHIGPKRSLNLTNQGDKSPTASSRQTQAFHTKDPAEIEKARLDILGSTEPHFDLGFDLDSLEDDDIDENDIVPPSPNPRQQQEYISLSQKSKLNNQSSSFTHTNVWTRTTSTPVLTEHSHQETKTYSDMLSPITADVIDRNNTDYGERLNKVSLSQSKSLSKRRLSIESFPSPRQKPQNSPNGLEENASEQAVDLSSPSVLNTKTLSPSGDGIHLPSTEQDINIQRKGKLSLRKRKSSPYSSVPEGCSTDVKRRRSEPASRISPLLTEPVDAEFCNEGTEGIQLNQRTMANSPEVIELDSDGDDHLGNEDADKPCTVDSDDDDDPLSQIVQPRKRKAIALTSPQTPAFKTPSKPCTASSKKATPVKPVISSSDDELESPFIQRSKKPRQILTVDEEENDFVDNIKNSLQAASKASLKSRLGCAMHKQQRPKRTRFASGHGRGFIEEEAEVSNDDEYSSDEEGSELDSSLDEFICHGSQPTQATQSALTADDMHAVYMQSVRSPNDGGMLHPSRNRFKMVPRETSEDLDIFSQQPVQDENYYENSFVVHEEDDVSDRKCREGGKDACDESLFENTINPDNILASRRRPRRQGISRAKQILKEGRRRVLKSSSSASTSAEETDEELTRQNKIPIGATRSSTAASASRPQEIASAEWLVAKEGYHDFLSQKLTIRNPLTTSRTSMPAENARSKEWTENLPCRKTDSLGSKLLTSDFIDHEGNKGPTSVNKQFLAGSSRETNSYHNVFLNQRQTYRSNNSNRMCAEHLGDGLTLADRERAERLKRQEEKKREFMRKMEEKKRQQQVNQARPEQQERGCALQQPQQDGYRSNKMQKQFQKNPLDHEFHPSAQLQRQQQRQQLQHHQQQEQKVAEPCLNINVHTDNPNLSDVPSSSSIRISVQYNPGGIPSREPANPALEGTGDDTSSRAVTIKRSPLLSSNSVQLMSRPTLAGSEDAMNRGKPVILIDTKELSSASHIVSTLILKHDLNPLVRPLSGCDYIVSSRMGVEKRTLSDFGNGANKMKLIDRMRHLCELFDRPCLILERDRVRPGDNPRPKLIRTKYFDSTLAALSKTHIKVLYSDSLEDTARILADLVRTEARKGESLPQAQRLDPTQEQILKLYLTLPRVSYATALSLLAAFPSVTQLVNSSPEVLHQKARISHQRAAEIVSFFQHQFDEQMTSLGTMH